ncbi:MAG TPA: tryptophan--tRNA ligase, partial [Thermoplasmata archaeon]|nr:tryptophan--tRNA ligase [Thermoplasmata archaeon]
IAVMYSLAVDIAKRIPYSTVKAVFGFPPSTNIGMVFYTALQTVPCLIPCGIDQDPHFRITRDLAESLGYPKPALLHGQMLPSLLGEAKMSTTHESKEGAIFLNDPPKEVERKIAHAFTGGRATVEEQRRLGATPEICSIWALWRTKFARDPAEFDEVTSGCRSGSLLCGECKSRVTVRVNEFLAAHGARREAVRDYAESLILEGAPGETGREAGPPLPPL